MNTDFFDLGSFVNSFQQNDSLQIEPDIFKNLNLICRMICVHKIFLRHVSPKNKKSGDALDFSQSVKLLRILMSFGPQFKLSEDCGIRLKCVDAAAQGLVLLQKTFPEREELTILSEEISNHFSRIEELF